MSCARRLRATHTRVLKWVVVTMTGTRPATCSRMAFVSTSRSSSESTNCSEKLASMHRPVEPASIMKSTQRFWLARSSSPASVKVVGTTGNTPWYLAAMVFTGCSFDDVEVFEELGLHDQAQAGLVVVELQKAVLGHRLAVKDVIK